MATAVAVRFRDTDAENIGRIYAQVRKDMVASVMRLLECGRLLIAKQDEMDDGQPFTAWLDANTEVLGFSRRNAYKLMAQARKLGAATPQITDADAVQISRAIWSNGALRKHNRPVTIESTPGKPIVADFESDEDDQPGDTPEERATNAVLSVSYSAAAGGQWVLTALVRATRDGALLKAANDAAEAWKMVVDQLKE